MIVLNTNVRSGDILLIRGPAIASKLIAFGARGQRTSRFSHSALYVGNGTFVESTIPAVQFLSVYRVHAQDKTSLAVLRLKNCDAEERRAIARRATVFVHQFLAHKYDLGAAIMSPFGGAPARLRPYVFCSALIALAYRRAGSPLFDTLPDHRVTPNRLPDSPQLEDVSARTFNENLDKVDEKGLDKVAERPIADYSRAMRDVLAEANRLFKEHGLDHAEGLADCYRILGLSREHPAIAQIDVGIVRALEAAQLDTFLGKAAADAIGGHVLERVLQEVDAPTLDIDELRDEVAQLTLLVENKRRIFADFEKERDFHLQMRNMTRLLAFDYLASWYSTLCLLYQNDGADLERALYLVREHLAESE